MSNNLGWGGIEKTPWAEMNTKEKEALVKKTLMNRDLRNIMGVSKKNLLKTRKATPEDVAKYKADNKTIKVDDDIYFTEKLQTVERAGGASGGAGSVTQQIALKKYNDSLKNKSDAVNCCNSFFSYKVFFLFVLLEGQRSLNLDIEFMLISHSTLLQYIAF